LTEERIESSMILKILSKRRPISLALATSLLVSSATASFAIMPTGNTRPDSQMQKVLTEQKKLGLKPLSKLSVEEARKQPSLSQASSKILQIEGKPVSPSAGITTKTLSIEGPNGPIPLRIYQPDGVQGDLPVIVYYHGGAWVLGNLDSADSSARALAKESQSIVVSVDYHRAPEKPFPASHQDAYTAYEWAWKNASSYNGDSARVAVAGEDAGGNLAANVSLSALSHSIPAPVYQLLIYPIVSTQLNGDAFSNPALAMPLSKADMSWLFKQELPTEEARQSPKVNLLKADVAGMPPTTIITAQIDPFRADAEALAQKMKDAGVSVAVNEYPGVTHGFFGLGQVVRQAKNAEVYAAQQLTHAFQKTPPGADAEAKQSVIDSEQKPADFSKASPQPPKNASGEKPDTD